MRVLRPSTFFPEIDESMERIYVRLPPGTSLADSSRRIQEMGESLRCRPHGHAGAHHVGSPKAARSAMTNPNWGPHMGFIRLALAGPEQRQLSQQDIADHMRHLLDAKYPVVEFLQWPGGLVAAMSASAKPRGKSP